MNVLIVDDNPTNLKVLRAVLEGEGMTVEDAGDGVEALEVLGRKAIDAIISDILMPRLDGYRLCHEVRTSERFSNLPFIIYSATYLSTADQKAALDLGADRFISKPAATKVIVEALRQITARVQTGRRAQPAMPEVDLLKAYSERLIDKLEEKNIQLEEQVRLATLGADIGLALAQAGTHRAGMQDSIEILARFMEVASACIWTLNEETKQLELECSAGRHKHLSGNYAVEKFNVGRIAQDGEPYLSNDICNDPGISDPQWAGRAGIVAFAGYPLTVTGCVVGVIAVFGHQPFKPAILETFPSLANQFAQCIRRRRAEEQLLAAKEAAERANLSAQDALDRLDLALNASETGIWTWYAQSNEMDWDGGSHKILGSPPGSFGGTLQDFGTLIHGEDRAAALREIQQCNPTKPEYAGEFRVIWPDGSVHHLDARGQAFYGEGLLLRVTGVIHDISVQRQLGEQLRQAQKMEAIGQLAGGIAHDFNNVLNVIIGYAQLLLEKVPANDAAYPRLDEIRKAGERAAALTRQLLAFSRKQVLQPLVLNLGDTLRDLDSMVRRMIGENIDIVTMVADDLAQVKVDPSQVQQVVLNLVVNARDAMPGGGKITLELMNHEVADSSDRAHKIPAGRYVTLSVSDNGSGMSPEIQKRAFEPFFTTKEVGRGTGLGLATVYGIVQQSGGHILLHSEPGAGTSFKLFFPRVDEQRQLTPSVPVQKIAGGDETILVVEDDPGLRALAQEVLSSVGYNVLVAEGGSAALSTSERFNGPIQLLLTDVVLPKMSGKDIASSLKASRPDMKVLFMSGYSSDVISHQGTLDRGVDFIQKPWTPQELCEKVHAVLATGSFSQRILVVDDDPGMLKWLAEVLDEGGHQVYTAEDAGTARTRIHQHAIDFVITDLVMPDEEGIELIQWLRKEYPKLAIIAISGAFGPGVLQSATFLGAQATLAKPISAKTVLQSIRDVSSILKTNESAPLVI